MFAVRGVHLADPPRRRRAWLIAGVLAGLALTYRPDLVIAVGLVLGWLLWRHRAGPPPGRCSAPSSACCRCGCTS